LIQSSREFTAGKRSRTGCAGNARSSVPLVPSHRWSYCCAHPIAGGPAY